MAALVAKMLLERNVAAMRVRLGIKARNADLFAVKHDLHDPFPLMGTDASIARNTVAIGGMDILQVDEPVNVPEIRESVVLPVPVDVVDMPAGPISGHVEPSQTVFQERLLAEENAAVSIRHIATGALAYTARLLLAFKPRKQARIGVVMERLAQFVRCQFNHAKSYTAIAGEMQCQLY
jgi:hypothetical protein